MARRSKASYSRAAKKGWRKRRAKKAARRGHGRSRSRSGRKPRKPRGHKKHCRCVVCKHRRSRSR